jgi:hypothetical protein
MNTVGTYTYLTAQCPEEVPYDVAQVTLQVILR